ncbi:MAG: hypothetical protein AB7O91_11900 [Sphingomonas sp.]
MSTIPKAALPQGAEPQVAEPGAQASNGSSFLFDNAQRIADAARANPKTAAAVGAGVVAATAAATVALARRGGSAGSRTRASRQKSKP